MFEKMSGESKDIVKDHVEKLKKLFPEVVSEGQVDFDKLKDILTEVDPNEIAQDERYNFTWSGKRKSIHIAQQPSKGSLRPVKEKSKNWDKTQNLYIEGDNLEVLKLLQKSYFQKVKMIYIDPPYNTGNDFVYKDDYKDRIENYLEQTGQVDSEGNKLSTNVESNGRFHSNWLNMMYPRLKLARNLLENNGFIAVSISDEELQNLKKLLDEIFGEKNYRNDILVRRYDKNINNQFVDKGLKSLNIGSEHILIYSKNETAVINAIFRKASEDRSKKGYWKGFWNDADRPSMRYDILGYTPNSGQWKWKKNTAEEAIKNYQVYNNKFSNMYTLEQYWKKTGGKLKFIRRRESLTGKNMGVEHWVPPTDKILRSSNWNDLLVSESLSDVSFDSPKSTIMLSNLLKMLSNKNSLILDFFAGSSSTAHSVMKLNADDGGHRQFVMVQLPEQCNEKSKAYEQGYRTICDIGEERIRRAGEKIRQELAEKREKEGMLSKTMNPDDLDIGFKVFKLDRSNIKEWYADFDHIGEQLDLFENNFVKGRSEEDIVYEIMLKSGLDLNYPIEKVDSHGKNIYNIAYGALFICLDDQITVDVADKLVELKNELNLEKTRVVFKDLGFKDDQTKINVYENLKANGFEELLSI
ncbi:site-specific DNA-methyltransferase [Sporolactobacillus terrae]|uniref:site-specific DNA-methyltransferase n=1 Tax=Sporolactobacillus terrae TaxID=269673 RepID=UPI00111B7728|nr:site-specific DNA-methyltransferase [Sporolactobacillus terrae]